MLFRSDGDAGSGGGFEGGLRGVADPIRPEDLGAAPTDGDAVIPEGIRGMPNSVERSTPNNSESDSGATRYNHQSCVHSDHQSSLNAVDFSIGSGRELDLVLRYDAEAECFGVNNEINSR